MQLADLIKELLVEGKQAPAPAKPPARSFFSFSRS